MKIYQRILLAGVAGFAAVSTASAADLGGIKKPAVAEYVRVCNAYGAGFFFIPGTDTCLKIGGRVRAEYYYLESKDRNGAGASGSGFREQGRLLLDARTNSEWGVVRAFTRIDIAKRTGTSRSGSQIRQGNAFENAGSTSIDTAGKVETFINIDAAFVQFAGFTAGRLTSFYDFEGTSLSWFGVNGSKLGPTNLVAYTATFGAGFSATVSVEDNLEARNRVFTPTSPFNPAGNAINYGNQALPDIVGALRVDQAWGSAQLSGALHQLYYSNTSLTGTGAAAPAITTGSLGAGSHPSSDYGFAVQGGVKINLPFIKPGDALYLQGSYVKGALSYIIGGGCGQDSPAQCSFTDNTNVPTYDAYATRTAAGGFNTKLTTAYNGVVGFTHYWTPTIRSNLNGSYTRFDYGKSTGLSDGNLYFAAFNTIWSPIKDLDIGAEVFYFNLHSSIASTIKNDDQWQFRMRIQRDF